MKRNAFFSLAAPVVFAAALSCATGPAAENAESAAPETSNAAALAEAPAAASAPPVTTPPPAENRLSEAAFKTIPAEARDYLERLSRAFIAHDEAFLLAQGEPQFEAEVRPRHDNESYLALLYRLGPYAADSPRLSGTPPRLAPADVSHIQYLSWEENGPLLEIKARLIGNNGETAPCLIMLVWRLREPKIEGLFL